MSAHAAEHLACGSLLNTTLPGLTEACQGAAMASIAPVKALPSESDYAFFGLAFYNDTAQRPCLPNCPIVIAQMSPTILGS